MHYGLSAAQRARPIMTAWLRSLLGVNQAGDLSAGGVGRSLWPRDTRPPRASWGQKPVGVELRDSQVEAHQRHGAPCLSELSPETTSQAVAP